MMIAAAISLGITIAGFLGGIFWKVATMSKDNGRLAQRVDNIETRAKEDRENDDKRFAELFSRTNAAEQNISTLNAKVDNLTLLCSKMDTKLDKLIESNK
jgi:uncharacterized coiled-coil protein SlyX